MSNTPTTTPASIASRLTDKEIEIIAALLEQDAENLYGDNTRSFMEDENNAAAVLRDYVRLRRLTTAVKAKIAERLSCNTRDCIEFCCRAIGDIALILEAAGESEVAK